MQELKLRTKCSYTCSLKQYRKIRKKKEQKPPNAHIYEDMAAN